MMCITLVSVAACNKHIEGGILTTITGHIEDTMRNEPVAGAKLYIVEYDKSCLVCRPRLRAVIDSGYTDAGGNYNITFETTGLGTNYKIKADDTFGGDYYGYLESGYLKLTDTSINFQTFRYSVLSVNVSMAEIPKPPLFIFNTITHAQIINFPADTVVNLKVVPRSQNVIYYQFETSDSGIIYRKEDTVLLNGVQDTFYRNISLDPGAFMRMN